MIVCPNCNHQNPDGATQCEACFTPLPATTNCPSCGATVQMDAGFCGQCGFNLKASTPVGAESSSARSPLPDIPDLLSPDPLIEPEPLPVGPPPSAQGSGLPATVVNHPPGIEYQSTSPPESMTAPPPTTTSEPDAAPPISQSPIPPPVAAASGSAKTQLQLQTAHLLHLQTNTKIELPAELSVIHIGKPNDQIPPDIDVSGFPNSEIVSRIHADIRVEGDTYYIEDVGSSNGTYVNHSPLPRGNRHRLRSGDRISLGKGDQVTFLFQIV